MKNTFTQIAVCLLFLFTFQACVQQSEKPSKTQTTAKKVEYKVPDFNAQNAYQFVKDQVDFGPRVPNSKGHAACRDYLIQKFKSFGLTVQRQDAPLEAFDGKILQATNIIAKYKPERRRRVLLCAHWDTRPFSDHDDDENNFNKPILGANDAGSGVAVLLELARILGENDIPLGVDLVLFDAEDYGQPEESDFPQKQHTYCLGSQYWSNKIRNQPQKPMYGILLDMVGAKNSIFTKEGTSMRYASSTMNMVWNVAADLGYSAYFSGQETKGLVDDHYYVNGIAGIPTIDIIHYDASTETKFGHYWHTQKDNMDIIDAKVLGVVGTTVLNVLYKEAFE